jgi:hypothetical protein
MANYTLNLNTLTSEALAALSLIDRGMIGTPSYMGVAWFWGSNGCKHYLRDASTSQRRRIHNQWLDAGLDLLGETLDHYAIIKSVMRVRVPSTEGELVI